MMYTFHVLLLDKGFTMNVLVLLHMFLAIIVLHYSDNDKRKIQCNFHTEVESQFFYFLILIKFYLTFTFIVNNVNLLFFFSLVLW